ncbi:MAG: hypothetical protein ACI9U2_000544, partial [Bradymonadia bacterium]
MCMRSLSGALLTLLALLAFGCEGTGILESGLPTLPPSELPVVGKPGGNNGACRGSIVTSIQGQLVA